MKGIVLNYYGGATSVGMWREEVGVKLVVKGHITALEILRSWGLFLKRPETFGVPQFPLYLSNAEVLSHQTSQSFCFFLH